MNMREAIGNINNVVYTEKTRYIMGLSALEYPILILHGATGNGKSMLGTIKFLSRVINSSRERKTYILAGRDTRALERRFIKSNRSVFNWYPFKGSWEYKAQGIGGATINIKTRSGVKHIYLTPFNNVSSYSRVLGDTLDGALIDEAVEADELFLGEIVSRLNRTKGSWLIATSNGGDPQHYFYKGMVNKSMRIEEVMDADADIIPTPDLEISFYEKERNKNWLTVHMGLEDNPVYDEEQLKTFYGLHPVGSFMYNSRMLGVRGFTEKAPFTAHMDESMFISYEELMNSEFAPKTITYQTDVGGHVFAGEEFVTDDMFGRHYNEYAEGEFGTDTGGHTVMVSLGFNRDYKKHVILDVFFPNHMEDHINVDRIYDRIDRISMKFRYARQPYLFTDGASPSFRSLLMSRRRRVESVRAAVKRDNSIDLDEKVVISYIQQKLLKKEIMILDTPNNRNYFYKSMIGAKLEDSGKLIDNKSWESDILDGYKYGISSMYRILVKE